MNNFCERLMVSIGAVCPVVGISVGVNGDSSTVRIDYAPTATDQQKSAAQSALAAFDWSDAAELAWQKQKARQAVINRMTASGDDVAVAFRALAAILNSDLNELRTAAGIPTKTLATQQAAWLAIINSGAVD